MIKTTSAERTIMVIEERLNNVNLNMLGSCNDGASQAVALNDDAENEKGLYLFAIFLLSFEISYFATAR